MNPIMAPPAGVEYMSAAAEILTAISWPLVLFAIIFTFRKSIRGLLAKLSELKVGGATARFSEAALGVAVATLETALDNSSDTHSSAARMTRTPLTEYYDQRADENPLNAILEAYLAVEGWFDRALSTHGIDIRPHNKKLGVREMSIIAVEQGMLPESLLHTVDGLSLMRNLALHKSSPQTPQEAREFLVLTDGLIYTLDVELAKYEVSHPPTAEYLGL
jgi:hypothetical protein